MKSRHLFALTALGFAFSTAVAAAPHTLINCIGNSPGQFSPAITNDANDFNASSQQVYNSLLAFKSGSTEIEPALAERWEISDDGLSYTFHLRRGVKFHNNQTFSPTRDFNADDVLFSFNRQADKNHPFHTVSNGTYFYFNWMALPKILKSVEKIDDYTVKIHLNKAYSPFLKIVAMDFLSIYSQEYADKMLAAGKPETIDKIPIGTGPFVFQTYQLDQAIRYTANADYWKGRADLDRLIFSITPDATARYAKLQTGACDVIDFPNIADIEEMKNNPKVRLYAKEGLNLAYIGINLRKAPLENVKVRQALNYATDKQSIINVVYQGGSGVAATNPFPPGVLGYNDNIQDYPFDLEKAKQLLVEAGYGGGFETEIWVQPVVRPSNPNPRRTAEILQADWAKIGIKAKLVTHEWADFNKRTREGEFYTGTYGWTSRNGDPDNFLAPLLGCENVGGTNYAGWCNSEFEALLQQAAATADENQRTALYQQALVIAKEQAPLIPLAHSVNYVPTGTRVQNFQQSPFGYTAFYGVSVAD
ncbi:peptide transporter [Chelonobacter oris]|uniref:Peptide transporter n=1 Tax=Chelonobacter oris TaxID=505317 RepID=A0A0A3AS93_9PAST|nr:ABC transporter substrate-binding protein [Chelonobacter oris]KGQ70627.1 peptide transporter [Chelonobacter oris]